MSKAEPDLGLGLVVRVTVRQIQVLFPAGGETRTYAADNAPLKRARFEPGASVCGHEGDTFTVTAVDESDGLLTYMGDGRVLPESSLDDSLSAEAPGERLLAGHTDASALFDLRLATLGHRHRVHQSPVRGFTGARIELLPHQLYIAHEVSRRQLPRVLLADEVGLGKTIEACLILHRMVVCGQAERVLILLPEPLIHQWFVELLRRFNLSFRVFDEQRCAAEDDTGTRNPFLEEQFVLCGIEFLSHNEARARQALEAGWNLLIVDEAHHLRWAPGSVGAEYSLVERFAAVVPGLLLLTASPEQSGVESHFARLRLLDPNRYPCFEQFVAEHDTYASVASEAAEIIATGSEAELAALLDRHGPGRVMFRNSRSSIAGFPKRIPQLVPLSPSPSGVGDARVQWLAAFLRRHPTTKVLVIGGTARDVRALEKALRAKIGIDIASFHEGLPLLQCDRQAAWFAEPEGARVLIASGIGGEGRNFQFVSHLVLMDLPRDPELIEQRIGRLDRIGQKRNIHIHVPYVRGTPEEGFIRWLHEGLDAFARPLVGGYQMLLQFQDRLASVTDELITETRNVHRDLCERIEAGRDRLLELNSCRPTVAADLVTAIREAEADDALERYMLDVFEQFGVSVEPLGEHDYLLRADHLFCDEFPLPRDHDAMRITYDRTHALSRPTITLLSWDHPMVQGAMDLVLGGDRGACAVACSRGIEGVLLQAVYVLEAVSTQRIEMDRFLPPTPILVQVDKELNGVAGEVVIAGDGESWWVRDNESLQRELVPDMIAASRALAEERAPVILADAETEMRAALDAEAERLRRLKALNDHVRSEEIEAAEAQISALAASIRGARLRLDGLRLVVGVS